MAKDGTNRGGRRVRAGDKPAPAAEKKQKGLPVKIISNDIPTLDTAELESVDLPEGAVPKDGPSAGVTMVTAMVSALTGKKVKGKLAMTGEISLSGKVWPVGGIKEKMLAAYRYGVKTVLLPKRNMQDLDELPENIRKEMQFIPVEHLDDVLKLALEDKNE